LGKIYTKNYQFLRFFGLQAHIYKAKAVKFGVKVRTWDFLPKPNFVEIAERGIPLFGKFIWKITNFDDFGGTSKPTF